MIGPNRELPRGVLPGAFLLLFLAFATCKLQQEDAPAASVEPTAGTLPDAWINGARCETEPPFQVHEYNPDLYILRQSKCTHYEAPFLYLLFGQDKAFLLDTGSLGNPPVVETVEMVVNSWLKRNGRERIDLIVAHSHSHGDHVAGDRKFEGRPDTTVVGTDLIDVEEFYGIENWPEQIVQYDLGGRVLDIIPTPGHHPAHITIYDRNTELLLTGDTLYPGFLFVFSPNDWQVFRASTRRMVEFIQNRPVRHVFGCHIEMSREPGKSYAYGTPFHPDERVLELTREHLIELDRSLELLGDQAAIEKHDDFVIFPVWLAAEWKDD